MFCLSYHILFVNRCHFRVICFQEYGPRFQRGINPFRPSILNTSNAIGIRYSHGRTAFTVVTTLVGTSAAWFSYFARQRHNQKLYFLMFYVFMIERMI